MDTKQRGILIGFLRNFLVGILRVLLLRRKSKKSETPDPPDNYGGTD